MIDKWNALCSRWNDTDVKAEPGDIVEEIDGVMFLLQRKNDFNNVVCLTVQPNNISHIKAMFMFILSIYQEGIRYIRIEGNRKRYRFLESMFGPPIVLKEERDDRNVYYCKLDDYVIEKLERILNYDD